MKFTMGVVGLIFVGVLGWFVGSRLSPDAIGMAVGIVFGILAGIPAALIVLTSQRQADRCDGAHVDPKRLGRNGWQSHAAQMPHAAQQPLIVFVGNSTPHQSGQHNQRYDQRYNQSGQNFNGYAPNGYAPNGYASGGYDQSSAPQSGTQYFDLGPAGNSPVGHNPAADSQIDHRQFRVVGEQEEWIEEWS